MVINLKKPVDKSRASNDSCSIYCLMFPGADLYLLCFYFLLWSFFFFCDADRVFAPACSTQRVYEEGAKDVALSALSGINGNLF